MPFREKFNYREERKNKHAPILKFFARYNGIKFRGQAEHIYDKDDVQYRIYIGDKRTPIFGTSINSCLFRTKLYIDAMK